MVTGDAPQWAIFNPISVSNCRVTILERWEDLYHQTDPSVDYRVHRVPPSGGGTTTRLLRYLHRLPTGWWARRARAKSLRTHSNSSLAEWRRVRVAASSRVPTADRRSCTFQRSKTCQPKTCSIVSANCSMFILKVSTVSIKIREGSIYRCLFFWLVAPLYLSACREGAEPTWRIGFNYYWHQRS